MSCMISLLYSHLLKEVQGLRPNFYDGKMPLFVKFQRPESSIPKKCSSFRFWKLLPIITYWESFEIRKTFIKVLCCLTYRTRPIYTSNLFDFQTNFSQIPEFDFWAKILFVACWWSWWYLLHFLIFNFYW